MYIYKILLKVRPQTVSNQQMPGCWPICRLGGAVKAPRGPAAVAPLPGVTPGTGRLLVLSQSSGVNLPCGHCLLDSPSRPSCSYPLPTSYQAVYLLLLEELNSLFGPISHSPSIVPLLRTQVHFFRGHEPDRSFGVLAVVPAPVGKFTGSYVL